MPEEHKNLEAALLAVQAEAPAVQKTKINPAFRSKYVSLDVLMETVMPILNKHGLIWLTFPCAVDGVPSLEYQVIHAVSRGTMTRTMPLQLAKNDPQGQGSAITYARRYSLMAVLGLVADEDDDGNKASQQKRPEPTAKQDNGGPRLASARQRGMLNGKAAEKKLPASQYANALLLVAGAAEPREFESEDAAQVFLNRMLDRLPAKLVDPALEALDAAVA